MAETLDLAKAFGIGGLKLNTTPGLTGSPYPADVMGAGPKQAAPQQQAHTQPAYNPDAGYEQWGGRSGYNSLVQGFNDQKQGVFNSSVGAADTQARNRGNDILTFLENSRAAQGNLETKAANNERARFQGRTDIRDSLGTGLRNVKGTLASRNATGATVGGEMAKALSNQARKQEGKVENQYELGNMDIAGQQNAINLQRTQGKRQFDLSKVNSIEAIVGAAEQSLAAINAAMAGASLPDRIALEQEKQRIRGEATNRLASHDATLDQGLAGIRAGDTNSRRGEALRMSQLGAPMASEFQYDAEAPQELGDTGPLPGGELPLFTFNRQRRLA